MGRKYRLTCTPGGFVENAAMVWSLFKRSDQRPPPLCPHHHVSELEAYRRPGTHLRTARLWLRMVEKGLGDNFKTVVPGLPPTPPMKLTQLIQSEFYHMLMPKSLGY